MKTTYIFSKDYKIPLGIYDHEEKEPKKPKRKDKRAKSMAKKMKLMR